MAASSVVGAPVGPRWKINCKSGSNRCEAIAGGENGTTSKAQIELAPLKNLLPGATTLSGRYVKILDSVSLAELAACKPFNPNSSITSRCFNQSHVYQTLDRFLQFVGKAVIVPIDELTYDRQKKAFYPINVIVDERGLDNAYFSDVERNLTFGDGEGKFAYAIDGDIIIHEAVHWLVWTINRLLADGYFGAGLAMHEGLADTFAALINGNSLISEDYRNKTRPKRQPRLFLRNVDNDNKFPLVEGDDTGPHEVGKIYSGFFWSLYKRILGLMERSNPPGGRVHDEPYDLYARIATLKIAVSFLDEFKVASPEHEDFHDAVRDGFTKMWDVKQEIITQLQHHRVSKEDVLKEIDAELEKRGFKAIVAKRIEKENKLKREGTSSGTAALLQPAFEKPVQISRNTLWHQQVMPTSLGRPAAVLGYGIIERNGKKFDRGVRKIERGSIDEEMKIGPYAARAIARRAISENLARTFERERPDAALADKSRQRLTAMALSKCKDARLAMVPGERELSWIFDAWPVEVAVSAKTGTARVRIKGIIDLR